MKKSLWIANPSVDLIFFSLGWIPLFFVFSMVHTADPKGTWVPVLIGFVLMTNFIHRNLTHLLVYGNPEEFRERKWAYVLLPVFLAALTVFSLWYENKTRSAPGLFKPYLALLLATTVWNFYHTIMQKVGFLRIYSRKADYGSARLEKALVLSWFVWLILAVANSPRLVKQISDLAASGRVLTATLAKLGPAVPILAWSALAVSLILTFLYVRLEVRQGRNASLPKNLFLASTMLLYFSVFYDFLAGFVAFGFSHALEYIAFVDVFARRKYKGAVPSSSFLARQFLRTGAVMPIAGLVLIAIFLPWRIFSPITLGWYYVGSSFLHYLYDGWIWKLRKPKVGSPLGLAYKTTA
ncbi:MAG TPA: hypothetical protein VFX30_03130 [bacterium]|nr:hypothetical protein [bacterium]